jgi:hypothetical protein
MYEMHPALSLKTGCDTVVGFLKLVELCKGLVVLPCLASSVEVYGMSRSLGRWVTCIASQVMLLLLFYYLIGLVFTYT